MTNDPSIQAAVENARRVKARLDERNKPGHQPRTAEPPLDWKAHRAERIECGIAILDRPA
jgi:hypothetical protein